MSAKAAAASRASASSAGQSVGRRTSRVMQAGGDIPIPQNAYCPSWGFPPACITREVRLPTDWTELLADARDAAAALAEK